MIGGYASQQHCTTVGRYGAPSPVELAQVMHDQVLVHCEDRVTWSITIADGSCRKSASMLFIQMPPNKRRYRASRPASNASCTAINTTMAPLPLFFTTALL